MNRETPLPLLSKKGIVGHDTVLISATASGHIHYKVSVPTEGLSRLKGPGFGV